MKVQTIDYHDANIGHKLLESFIGTGFAVIENHPIMASTIQSVYEDWKKFFDSGYKVKYLNDGKSQNGYWPYKSEKAKDKDVFDLKEFFHYYDGDKLPVGVGDSTLRLRRELNSLGIRLLSFINADLPKHVKESLSEPLYKMAAESPNTLFRILHYPGMEGTEQEGAVRSAPHEDINLITLLPAATQPGLQVKDLEGKWHAIECNPGTIVVNAGDMLKEATGGLIPSTTHQVVNPTGKAAIVDRYSMPLFVHPRPDVRLSERHTAHSYLMERLREIGLIK